MIKPKGDQFMETITVLNNEPKNHMPVKDSKDMEIERLNDKLKEKTAEMNQFSYIVTHDLQAPLRTITGFLELLEKKHGEKLEDSAKQYIGYVVKGAVKMKSLIFDLLEYSRLNTANLEKADVDLNEVMQEILAKYATEIGQRNIKISVSQLPVVMANRKQMGQLFEELFDNAMKFTVDTASEISLQAKNENGYWVFCIKDNGIGIDQAFFEKIFIIFRRLNTDEVKYPGTGVGLTISKKILELHDGNMWLESAVDKGSEIYFKLPENK